MSTTFPQQTQFFPQMIDVTSVDGALIQQYQAAMQAGNIALAKQILSQIPNNQSKIVTADYLNTINDTLTALQNFYAERYSPAYVVSVEQPLSQEKSDFWFQVTG